MVGLTTPGAMLDDGNLSPRDISPICSIRWLGSRSRMVGTNAFPYINTPSFRVPDAALGEQVPIDVELPNARRVADDGWHVADSWINGV
jgi:hypothetical protein